MNNGTSNALIRTSELLLMLFAAFLLLAAHPGKYITTDIESLTANLPASDQNTEVPQTAPTALADSQPFTPVTENLGDETTALLTAPMSENENLGPEVN